MPKETTNGSNGSSSSNSKQPLEGSIAGVTQKAREARAKEERPAGERTLSIMPAASDLASVLGIRGTARSQKPEASEEEETEEQEEAAEEAEEATEEEHTEEAEEATEEEDSEADDAGASDEEEEEEEDASPEVSRVKAGMQKRIDKLTAIRGELESRVEELVAEVAEVRREGSRPASTPADPLGHILSVKELEEQVAEARRIKSWALRNQDGAEVAMGEGKEPKFYTAEEVRNILANTEELLDAADGKRAELERNAKGEEMTRQVYAPFFQKGSAESKVREDLLKTIPKPVQQALRSWRGDWEMILIDAMLTASVRTKHPKTWFQKVAGVLSEESAGAGTGGKKPEARGQNGGVRKAPPAPGGRVAPKVPTKGLEARKRAEALKRTGGGSVRELSGALMDRLNF